MATMLMAMLQPLLWALPLLLLGALLKNPAFKGWFGEYQVRQLVRRRLDPSVYREFHNVTIPSPLGETTQIDHVYVSPFGVLVIETKNLGHWIWGRQHEPEWTQQIYRKKTRFQNPLRQNYAHVKALEVLLGLPESAFKPIVVFVGDCEFKTEMPVNVCDYGSLIEYIHSLDERILSQDEIDRICGAIQARRLAPTLRVHRNHVANLRRRHAEPVLSTPSQQPDFSQGLVEAAGQRLLVATEDRIRSGGRRQVTRGLPLGLGLAALKGLFVILMFAFVLWGLNNAVKIATRPLQAKANAPVASAPRVEPLPAPPPVVHARALTKPPPRPIYYHPTAEEVAESQRRADEAMRVLAPNTPEVPLVLPGSPQ